MFLTIKFHKCYNANEGEPDDNLITDLQDENSRLQDEANLSKSRELEAKAALLESNQKCLQIELEANQKCVKLELEANQKCVKLELEASQKCLKLQQEINMLKSRELKLKEQDLNR